jgi:hypothetical protein
MNPAMLMLGRIRANYMHDTCEYLGGFGAQEWVELILRNGEVRIETPSIDMSIVRLVHFDLDYENGLYCQTWDHTHMTSAPNPEQWQHVILFNTAQNNWVPEAIFGWGDYRPSFMEAGDVMDSFLKIRNQNEEPCV